jgi:hypothetical protein
MRVRLCDVRQAHEAIAGHPGVGVTEIGLQPTHHREYLINDDGSNSRPNIR